MRKVVSRRRFFYAPKPNVINNSYSNRLWIGHVLGTQFVPIFFQISQYLLKSKFEFWKFYSTSHKVLQFHELRFKWGGIVRNNSVFYRKPMFCQDIHLNTREHNVYSIKLKTKV